MKILQLGKFYPILGGVEKVMYDLMVGLSEQGVDCDMLCADHEGEGRTIQINQHGRVITTHTWKKMMATMISPEMIATLRKICHEYDIIHVHHPDPMACLALLLSGYKGKVVVHWHSDIEKQKVMLRLYKPLQNWMLRRADMVLGTTPVYLAESTHLEKVQHKTQCLPIGIEPLEPHEEGIKRIQAQYPNKKIIFSLGRLVPYKGYRHLIEAASELEEDYVVLIGGTGPLKEHLEKEIEAWGVQDKVFLLGHISDEELPQYYGACRVFCISSTQKTEAFCIAQIEAMSCGKPVVATRIPHSGVAWVNHHKRSGLNVAPGNASELALAIQTIDQNPELYNKLAAGATQRFHDTFTKERMIEKVREVYERLMKSAARGGTINV